MRLLLVAGLSTLAACSSSKEKEAEPAHEVPKVGELVRSDAGITAVVADLDPPDRHLDEDTDDGPAPQARQPARAGKPIDITLRSTPPGAQVAVDGLVIGNTPAYWSGTADGREHEFVFTMRGHAIARYRFVPIASGVIHGRLDRIHEENDKGVRPPPEVAPPRPPTSPSVNPPSAPPTIVQPGTVSVTPPGTPPPTTAPGTPPAAAQGTPPATAPGSGMSAGSEPAPGSGSPSAPGAGDAAPVGPQP